LTEIKHSSFFEGARLQPGRNETHKHRALEGA
jgi:hypothetical protein